MPASSYAHLPLAQRLILEEVDRRAHARFGDLMGVTLRQEPDPHRLPRVAWPLCLNDKFIWRKIFDRNPDFKAVANKLAVRDWAAAEGIDVTFPRVLWRGRDPEKLPPRLLKGWVMVKTNHGWQSNIAIRGGRPGRAAVLQKAREALAQDHGRRSHEWSYLGMPRRVFVEEWIGAGRPLDELKMHTYGARIGRVSHTRDRFGAHSQRRYEADAAGVLRPSAHPPDRGRRLHDGPLPAAWPEAVRIARSIGSRFDHMRVDLLIDADRVYLGELTVYHLAGAYRDIGWYDDHPVARMWDLRQSWFLTTPQRGWRAVYARVLRQVLDAEARRHPPPGAASGIPDLAHGPWPA